MTAASENFAPVRRRFAVGKKTLPYLLSLPALLVCIGILIPFVTAVFIRSSGTVCRNPGRGR